MAAMGRPCNVCKSEDVDAVNDAKAYVVGKKLIEMGRTPDRASLEDPAADLKAQGVRQPSTADTSPHPARAPTARASAAATTVRGARSPSTAAR